MQVSDMTPEDQEIYWAEKLEELTIEAEWEQESEGEYED